MPENTIVPSNKILRLEWRFPIDLLSLETVRRIVPTNCYSVLLYRLPQNYFMDLSKVGYRAAIGNIANLHQQASVSFHLVLLRANDKLSEGLRVIYLYNLGRRTIVG